MAEIHAISGNTITISAGNEPITIDVGNSKIVTIRLEVSTAGSSYVTSEPPKPRRAAK